MGPVLRTGVMEILKLSVNGEELNTIRGARSLLSKRQICTVMMHVGKVQVGWQAQAEGQNQSAFSAELYGLLDDGALDLALHLMLMSQGRWTVAINDHDPT